MTGRGRGRGRGATFGQSKPGGGASRLDPQEQLTKMISSLTVESTESEQVPVMDLALKVASSDAEKLEGIMQQLIGKCQKDWRFSTCAAEICQQLVAHPVCGSVFRKYLLNTLRSAYKEKESCKDEDPLRGLGCFSIMCQTYARIRTATGEPFKPLTKPIADDLNKLLGITASEEELQCVCTQLFTIGPLLVHHMETLQLNMLRNSLRDIVVMETNASEATITDIISVLEGFASKWKDVDIEALGKPKALTSFISNDPPLAVSQKPQASETVPVRTQPPTGILKNTSPEYWT